MSSIGNTTTGGEPTGFGNATNPTDDPPAIPGFDITVLVYAYARHVDAKRLATAFMAWVAYDFIITIDDSINLFWSNRWSLSKTMYLISRYNTLFTVIAILTQILIPSPSISYCNAAPWIELAGSIILIIIIDLAMITRVYALWNRDKRVLAGTLSLFAIHIISYTSLLCYGYLKGISFVQLPPFTGCMTLPGYDKVWLSFIASLGFEITIVFLTVYQSWSVASQKGIRTPIYTMLLEDGLSYFLIIITSQIMSIVGIMVPSALTLPLLGSYPSIPIAGVACGRLFIRLQRLLLRKDRGSGEFSTQDIWSTNVQDFSYGGGPAESEPVGPKSPHESQGPWTRLWLSKNRAVHPIGDIVTDTRPT